MTSTDDGLWFRRFADAGGAAHRVVCFPHAGGSAPFFKPMALALAPEVDVVAVQYPGRQDRRHEPPMDRIADLADGISTALPGLLDRPLTFFGHSMGAVVAFEVARRLAGEPRFRLTRLVASGRPSPALSRSGRVHQLDDDGLATEIAALGGTDARLLREPEVRAMILPAVRADYRAVETYRFAAGDPLEVPITALIGTEDAHTTVAEAQDWATHTTGPCELVEFPGGHFFIVDHAPKIIELVAAGSR
ncbi:alpha/beta fold hydrolase [Amycolatopsis rhabdoformis]|uniref:Alpha/beta fold hydrolase n=1 Tax=Amycolatopsis rhabdoformis TaxID=1448059 RepID=A0ABZ1IL45_9PSEU|nr:alpha/beta fold hydrolase [Amycolatopsis rhabdoformis]WSE34586.1 alpha/beta fold hydrolase [Amycolatopsis rhabdoformis]